ncbi:hypothetical protein [Ferrimicrobium acidiphilum]|uniref:hypothetical protein n=1 Tax=Ferrimicrobium acidiphilum TaxID=121039 RepID=UPI0023F4CDD0|nr:hypothetical protein [Ferrimicrobium acidiphilum]
MLAFNRSSIEARVRHLLRTFFWVVFFAAITLAFALVAMMVVRTFPYVHYGLDSRIHVQLGPPA